MDKPRRVSLESSWEWMQFAAGLPAKAYPFSNITGAQQLITGRYIYMGASAENGDSSSHFFVLRDGQDATGEIIVGLGVASLAYVTDRVGGSGTLVEKGIFLSLTGGPWQGSVYAVPLWHYWNTAPGE